MIKKKWVRCHNALLKSSNNHHPERQELYFAEAGNREGSGFEVPCQILRDYACPPNAVSGAQDDKFPTTSAEQCHQYQGGQGYHALARPNSVPFATSCPGGRGHVFAAPTKVILLLLTLFLTPATRAADKPPMDDQTADLLNDIATAKPTSPKNRPSKQTPPQSDWQHWRDLTTFFAPGLALAAAIGIAGAVCGVLVLLRREALLALALPQVFAAGAAVGLRLNWPTLPPALVAAGAALLYLVITRRRRRHGNADAALPALYISGLCLSFLVIAGASAHVEELQNLFTGIDVAVTPARAFAAAPILLAVAVAVAISWRRWLIVAHAPAAAELAGVNPARWDALFLILLTTVLLLGTDSQGVVMVLAMLFLPAATVFPWAKRIPTALIAAAAISLIMVATAFILSNALDWPLSQSAGGAGFVLLLISHLLAFAIAT